MGILKELSYTSLAELQIKTEEDIARNPISTTEPEMEDNPTENLYYVAEFTSIYDCLIENHRQLPKLKLTQSTLWLTFCQGFEIMLNYHANLFFFQNDH